MTYLYNGDFHIRRMSRNETDTAIEWANLEGWNAGICDAESFFQTDPNGFFIGELNGQPIGCISAVIYDDSFGFIGFYIVKPEFRGLGYGIKLWNEAIKYLCNRTIGLDGVIKEQENYKRSGFIFAYRNIRFSGVISSKKSNRVIEVTNIPIEEIVAYDSQMFPTKREKFIKKWITQPNSYGLCIKNSEGIKGYGVIRKCMNGYKIGPLFADDEHIAFELFDSLTEKAKGDIIYLDIPEVNQHASKLVTRYKMNKVFETARMYTKELVTLPFDKIYGVTSFELG